MNETYKLIQDTIARLGYKVLDDDGEILTVLYQLNVIHISPDMQDGGFVTVFTPIGETVSHENRVEVLEKCNKLSSKVKVMKYCVYEDEVVATSEFFFRIKAEVKFQLLSALNQIAAASAVYSNTRV